ncbi:BRISC and BRCA1-A complex member 2 isoform X2 [Carica papaya]|uniref:BRISC and BRCA1-A complex member 2 isoform X2 n=1 Tax=Carica papaya TaxID=3649 RepID=UPI000B8C7114|nr:BRISC and BRCA1-A complex member 2 isoform X2 [Carica papaya]
MAFEGFPPLISAQLHYLLNHYPHIIKIEQVWSGNKYYPRVLDRFTLVIPYCLDTIKWHVIYNSEYPLTPPDVIFGPEDEDFHPLQVAGSDREQDVKSVKKILSDWSNKDPTKLLGLIQELRDQYMAYQRRRVGEVDDDRLKFEINTILSREGIEMHMSSGAEKPVEVKFAVPLLEININKMVLGCPWRHQQKMYLQVIYPVNRKYTSAPSAPRLKLMSTFDLKALFSVDDVKLPPWMDGMCMAEYLPHLEETLERQVFCRKATFLASSGTFVFLVHFSLPTQFPKQQPALVLQSSQHLNSPGAPIKSNILQDYPWSPRWDAAKMAERIFDFVADESLNFKRQCNEALQH